MKTIHTEAKFVMFTQGSSPQSVEKCLCTTIIICQCFHNHSHVMFQMTACKYVSCKSHNSQRRDDLCPHLHTYFLRCLVKWGLKTQIITECKWLRVNNYICCWNQNIVGPFKIDHVELVDLEGYFTAALVQFVDAPPPPTGNMHISVS